VVFGLVSLAKGNDRRQSARPPLYGRRVTGEPAFSRRVVLKNACAAAATAAASGGLSGCTSTPSAAGNRHPSIAPPQPSVRVTGASVADRRLLIAALTGEQQLFDYISGVVGAYPTLAGRLHAVRGAQREHVAVLRRVLGRSASGRAGPMLVPGSAKGAHAQLLQELRRQHDRRTEDCLAATSGPVARLFASVGASHAMALAALTPSR
jgi:hypothetical protein